MADRARYAEAIARVRAGNASTEDYRLCEKMASNCGSGQPAQAREALQNSGRGISRR